MIHSQFQEIVTKYDPDLPIPYFKFKDQSFIRANSYQANLQPYTNKATQPVYNQLIQSLSPECSTVRRDKNKNPLPLYDLQAQMITYIGALAIKNGYTAIKFPFNKNYYNVLNSVQHRTDANVISYEHTMEFVNRLVNNGYMVKIKGAKYQKDHDRSHSSVLVFTEKFLKLFDGVYLKAVKPQHNWFELRQRKQNKIDVKTVVAVNDEISFTNSKIYKRAITNLNKLCVEQSITMNGFAWQPQFQAVGLIDIEEDINSWDRDMGMRIYGGSFQCEPSGKLNKHKELNLGRQTLRIKYNDTVEADFSGIHISAAYIKSGEYYNPELDMYALQFTDFINEGYDADQLRQLTKMSVNMMFNAKNDNDARAAIQANYNKLKKTEYNSIHTLNILGLMDEIKRMHSPIAHLFCSDLGVKLQTIDSEIAIRVIDHFTKKGVICLPYHDSFCVEAQYREELIEVMEKAWKKVLVKMDLCKIKVSLHDKGITYQAKVFETVDRYVFKPTEQLQPEFETIPDTAYRDDLSRAHEEELEEREDYDLWMETTTEQDRRLFVNGAVQNLFDWTELADKWQRSKRDLTPLMLTNRDNLPIPF
ncbi:hypothetical protein R7Q10_21800 [Vibrio sp. Vb0599]|uniref:hypothetical protein n=1 Tax=Vibrio sp. Vb0599 TaxID=3074628 RepID=UPI002965096F|nr:hypothetical protein [Vibrio sp. Vb0599]MDW1944666.1 hypothetical protein [Vibrio sp. Vb0599]